MKVDKIIVISVAFLAMGQNLYMEFAKTNKQAKKMSRMATTVVYYFAIAYSMSLLQSGTFNISAFLKACTLLGASVILSLYVNSNIVQPRQTKSKKRKTFNSIITASLMLFLLGFLMVGSKI